ncbi:MAG: TetR/AcrR family transcriptional regulator [Actinobacteria bacterium]|nr:TetR/AcrR family transcriptional regulator [Actinomycetota bacterium]MBO0786957.1 TetR/AcrR family transcriptional regulator [Actinomycetota bacterium]
MAETARVNSPRRDELLERAYQYVLEHGLAGMSLRPLAATIGSSPRVLLFLFGSKDALVRAILARARADELAFLADAGQPPADLPGLVRATWRWLAGEQHRRLLTLWVEAYGRSLADPAGPWADFARQTVADWLALLAAAQPGSGQPEDGAGQARASAAAERTLALAVLRGALLDLLATGDTARASAAVGRYLEWLDRPGR